MTPNLPKTVVTLCQLQVIQGSRMVTYLTQTTSIGIPEDPQTQPSKNQLSNIKFRLARKKQTWQSATVNEIGQDRQERVLSIPVVLEGRQYILTFRLALLVCDCIRAPLICDRTSSVLPKVNQVIYTEAFTTQRRTLTFIDSDKSHAIVLTILNANPTIDQVTVDSGHSYTTHALELNQTYSLKLFKKKGVVKSFL